MNATTWPEGHPKSTGYPFNWRKDPEPAKELTKLEKNRAYQRSYWNKKTAAEKAAAILTVNKPSEIAASTRGANIRADQIRRGGI
jgi:hypothetical protein